MRPSLPPRCRIEDAGSPRWGCVGVIHNPLSWAHLSAIDLVYCGIYHLMGFSILISMSRFEGFKVQYAFLPLPSVWLVFCFVLVSRLSFFVLLLVSFFGDISCSIPLCYTNHFHTSNAFLHFTPLQTKGSDLVPLMPERHVHTPLVPLTAHIAILDYATLR